jgi:hypothetical protein
MKSLKLQFIAFFTLISICLCGCNISESPAPAVTVGRVFTVDEINAGIKEFFLNKLITADLWIPDTDNSIYSKSFILNNDIEYDLYFERYERRYELEYSAHLVFTNRLFTDTYDDEQKLYAISIKMTEFGMQSSKNWGRYYYENEVLDYSASPQERLYPVNRYSHYSGDDDDIVFLGSHSLRIDEITRPQFHEPDEMWLESAERYIRIFMDYYGGKYGLEPGNYSVYVPKFFRADDRSDIVFLHENGNFYISNFSLNDNDYSRIHHNFELDGNINELSDCKLYVDMLREDSVINMRYRVTAEENNYD